MRKECDNCEGTGWTRFSCCGHDMRHADILICPERGCQEHVGEDGEDCEECDGTGFIQVPMTNQEMVRGVVLAFLFCAAITLITIAIAYRHASKNTSPAPTSQPGLVRK